MGKGSKFDSDFYGKITVFQTFWPKGLRRDHFMKRQLNQEMQWPTNRQKQLFKIHAQYGQHGTSH